MTSPSPEQPTTQPEPIPAAPSIWQGDPVGHPAPMYSPSITSGNAIVALVLAIVSWIIPVVLAIVALVFARKADREIAGSQGRIGGEAFVTAAKILAWINLGIFTAIFVLLLFAVFFLTLAGVASN